MAYTEEKNYYLYAMVTGSRGHVVYTAEPARAVYRRHYTGKCQETVDFFSGEERVSMYMLERLQCTQQVAKIRQCVWSLWLHNHGYNIVSEKARAQIENPDRRDLAAVKRIKLKPKIVFAEDMDLSNGWVFSSTRRTLSFTVTVEEYAEACHQAADAALPISTYCRERFYDTMPPRQSISEVYRCLQRAETAGRLADTVIKQAVLARVDPNDYAELAVETSALRDATVRLSAAIHAMTKTGEIR